MAWHKLMTFLFTLLAISLFWKCANLWLIDNRVGNDGMAITFLGFEIRSQVPAEELPMYARMFFVCGSIAVMTAFISIFRRTLPEEEAVDIEI